MLGLTVFHSTADGSRMTASKPCAGLGRLLDLKVVAQHNPACPRCPAVAKLTRLKWIFEDSLEVAKEVPGLLSPLLMSPTSLL